MRPLGTRTAIIVIASKIRPAFSVGWAVACLALLINPDVRSQGLGKEQKATSAGSIGLTVTNVGTIGNSFRGEFFEGQPSSEYPIGSGIEHMFDGGLWIGAFVRGEPVVSTGAAGDDANGFDPGDVGYEMTPVSTVMERSSLLESPVFQPDAVSHQDFVVDFTDSLTSFTNPIVAIREHTKPLTAAIHLETYTYNFSFADFFVILNYTITNQGRDTWEDVWLGLWTNFVVRNVKITAPRGSDFFAHGGIGFVDSLNLRYKFDADGDKGFTDTYIGAKVLGGEWRSTFIHPKTRHLFPDSLLSVNFQVWGFRSRDINFGSPRNDAERYGRMSSTLKPDLVPQVKGAGNWLSLVSVGPLAEVSPGETINIAFAIVAGQMTPRPDLYPDPTRPFPRRDLPEERVIFEENSRWAQRAFNGEDRNTNGVLDAGEDVNDNGVLDRYTLPSPPIPPRVKVIAGDRRVTIFWDKRAESSIDPISKQMDFEGYRVYRTNPGDDLISGANLQNLMVLLAEIDSTGNAVGLNTGFESRGNFEKLTAPVKFPGDDIEYFYKYEVGNLLNGWQYLFTVTGFDEGNPEQRLPSLESSLLQNTVRAFPGTPANDNFSRGAVGVYPNPYYAQAVWDGSSERNRKIYFNNLPTECRITIYTLSGDVVDQFDHNGETYQGEDILWFTTFGGSNATLAGGEHGWDMISRNDQTLATGLYLFTVKDMKSGEVQRGKFVIIK